MKLDHIVLRASDLSAALGFYRALFEFIGWREVPDPGGKSVGFQHADGLTIWLNESEQVPMPSVGAHLDHYAFHCESREEVDRAFEFCCGQKWKILNPPTAYPQYGSFYGFAFAGPDNLKLEFVTR